MLRSQDRCVVPSKFTEMDARNDMRLMLDEVDHTF
jgi:hypothetical protein